MSVVALLVALGIAALAAACALASVLAASRAAAHHRRAENRRLQEFGAALTQAAHELAALAASQSTSIAQAQAQNAAAVAAAARTASQVTGAEARLVSAVQRAEQALATANAGLQRAQDGLLPLSELARDLPGAIGTAVRDAAQTSMEEAASHLNAAAGQVASAALEAEAHIAAASTPIDLSGLHAAVARIEAIGGALESAASPSADLQDLAGLAAESVTAAAAMAAERAALAADRTQNERIATLLLRLGEGAAHAASHAQAATAALPAHLAELGGLIETLQRAPMPAAAAPEPLIADVAAYLEQQFAPHFAEARLLDERLAATAQALNHVALGAVRHELAATAVDRASRAQVDATTETIRALGHFTESQIKALAAEVANQTKLLAATAAQQDAGNSGAGVVLGAVQNALRYMETALERAAVAVPAQDAANERVLLATQALHAAMARIEPGPKMTGTG